MCEWVMIRVPKGLHSRLDALRRKELEAYQQGKLEGLPDTFIDRNSVPLYHVIEKAIDHLERKRRRSAKGKPANAHRQGKAQ